MSLTMYREREAHSLFFSSSVAGEVIINFFICPLGNDLTFWGYLAASFLLKGLSLLSVGEEKFRAPDFVLPGPKLTGREMQFRSLLVFYSF